MRSKYGSESQIRCCLTLLSHGRQPFFLYNVNLLIVLRHHRHPCNEKPSAISDITLRLSEGIQELKLEQQLAPTKEAISRTITAGSANFFKAVEGVKGRFIQRSASSLSVGSTSTSSGTIISRSEVLDGGPGVLTNSPPPLATPTPKGMEATAIQAKERLSGWGASVGSFFASRAVRLSTEKAPFSSASAPPSTAGSPVPPAQEAPWIQSSPTSPVSSAGIVKLPPMALKTPPLGSATAVDLGEKTPRGGGFSLDGVPESQRPPHEYEHEHDEHERKHERVQDHSGGDSDEEPSFGVAL